MYSIPVKCFFLKLSKWKIYLKFKKDRDKILKKHSHFVPADPKNSPIPALYDLYADTDPDVLYYFVNRLIRDTPSNSTIGNIGIGIVASFISTSITETLSPHVTSAVSNLSLDIPFSKKAFIVFIFFVIFAILISFIVAVYLAFVKFISPLFISNPIAEKEIEIIYQVLSLDEYFAVPSSQKFR